MSTYPTQTKEEPWTRANTTRQQGLVASWPLAKATACTLLMWHPRDDAVTVSVEDSRVGHRFELLVDRCCALDAFYHPYAYAA